MQVRIDLQRFLEVRNGAGAVASLALADAAIVPGVSILRIEQHAPAVTERAGIGRIDLDGLFQIDERAVELLLLSQRKAAVAVCEGKFASAFALGVDDRVQPAIRSSCEALGALQASSGAACANVTVARTANSAKILFNIIGLGA